MASCGSPHVILHDEDEGDKMNNVLILINIIPHFLYSFQFYLCTRAIYFIDLRLSKKQISNTLITNNVLKLV